MVNRKESSFSETSEAQAPIPSVIPTQPTPDSLIATLFGEGFLHQTLQWLPKLSKFMSLEIVAQILSIATSFLIIRCFEKADYAYYSLAYGFQGSLAIFSLTGVSTGLTSMAAQAATPAELRSVLASASKLRIALVAIGVLVAIPCFAYMLIDLGCGWLLTTCLLGMSIAILLIAIQSQMLVLPLRLHGQYLTPQLELVISSTLRLVLTAALIGIGLSTAGPAMLVGVVSSGCGLIYLNSRARSYSFSAAQPSKDVSAKLRGHFWVGLPSSLTYLLESQFAIAAISIMGSTSEVAELGALSRIALIFAIPTAVINGILIPRFSTEKSLSSLRRLWMRSIALSVVLGAGLFVGIYFCRPLILWMFGSQYSQLNEQLQWMALLQAFVFIANVMQVPIVARGWVKLAWMRPVFCFGSQLIAIALFDVGTVNGAIALMAAGAIGNTVLNSLLLVQGWRGKGELYPGQLQTSPQ